MALILPAGKIPAALLEPLLRNLPKSEQVLVGARYGEDAAVVAGRDEECWVITTDPITFATDQLGWYLAQVNANDIASMGATPEFFTATLLFPAGKTTAEQVEECFRQVRQACLELGISWIGGHTEVTSAVSQTVACGQMIGRVERSRLVTSSGARDGDDIVLIGLLGVEGTALLAREKRGELSAHFAPEFLDRAARFLFDPGIGITQAAKIACRAVELHAMHDPTEGGLGAAVRELGAACGLGAVLFDQPHPVAETTQALCAFFGLDVLGLISSGSLLVACDPSQTPRLLEALRRADLPAARIGQMQPASLGFRIGARPLPVYERDELARVL
ncbi:MAG: hydrogenase expression protein [Acidobacteria bacterium]|nr:hydrogenase expression protein [Acidobacteriota bacterium]